MEIVWIETPGLEIALGHGAMLYFMKGDGRKEFVAFLEGYDWHYSSPDTITIQIRSPGELSDPAVIEKVKHDAEKALKEKRLWQGEISERVFVWLNA
jgi:hypothetical protein